MSDRANFGKDSAETNRKRRQSDFEARKWRKEQADQARATRQAARALRAYSGHVTGRPNNVTGGTVAGAGCLMFILWFAKLVLVGAMFYWNITDIINVGPNFWNIFWLCLAAALLFSGRK